MLQVVVLSLLLLSVSCLAAPSQLPSAAQLATQSTSQSAQQRATDLDVTPILTVTDETRYTALNPDVELVALSKVKHGKGNIVFTAGARISGDKLLVNIFNEETFTKPVNTEVRMTYPASGKGSTLTCIEIYVDSSVNEADAYFFDGAIGKTTASILLSSDQTRTFSYEAFFYGY